jgi:hypothetical protein
MTNKEQHAAAAMEPKLQFHKAEDFKSFYVNWVQSSFTPFDISLVVGEFFSADEPGTFEVMQKARIILNPVEAKIISGMLLEALKNYQLQFGSVTVPSGLPGHEEVENAKEQNAEGM